MDQIVIPPVEQKRRILFQVLLCVSVLERRVDARKNVTFVAANGLLWLIYNGVK